jgi:hypothetical protein
MMIFGITTHHLSWIHDEYEQRVDCVRSDVVSNMMGDERGNVWGSDVVGSTVATGVIVGYQTAKAPTRVRWRARRPFQSTRDHNRKAPSRAGPALARLGPASTAHRFGSDSCPRSV